MSIFSKLLSDSFYIRLLGSLLLLSFFYIGRKLLSRLTIRLLSKIEIKHNRLDVNLFEVLNKPFNHLFLVTGIYLAVCVSPFVDYHFLTPENAWLNQTAIPVSFISYQMITRCYQSFFVAMATWIIFDLEHVYESLFSAFNERHELTDNTLLLRFIAKILRFITVALGSLLSLIALFPKLSSLLTGVGLGGVAVAFVSKDLLANILSGILLMMDKPFVIGDWIELQGIEGIVEDISFRSTRIRTFTQGVVVIPNATISNGNITNWSQMEKRRVKFDFGLVYDLTSSQLETCTKAFKALIEAHPKVENDTCLVTFDHFGDYALTLQILYYSLCTNYNDYQKIKEDINLKLLNYCEKEGIGIAFPTQTLLVQNPPLAQ